MSGLLGTRVRFIWPDDGTLSNGVGVIEHASWGEDGRTGVLVRWDSYWSESGDLVPVPVARVGWYADVAWLAGPDGNALVPPPRTEVVAVAGDVL